MKRCYRCGEYKPYSEFYRDSSKKDGKMGMCKSCYTSKYKDNKIKITEKKCRCCGAEKPVSEFYKSVASYDGFGPYCKQCHLKKGNDARHRSGRHKPLSQNKQCSAYLGVHIAERVLANAFGSVEKTKYGFPGYDFICGKGYKIDAKSCCRQKTIGKSDRWKFHIAKNNIADYFLCLAFDNRSDLEPEHVWIIPGRCVSHATSIGISEATLDKWREWERPLGKISCLCDVLRTK